MKKKTVTKKYRVVKTYLGKRNDTVIEDEGPYSLQKAMDIAVDLNRTAPTGVFYSTEEI